VRATGSEVRSGHASGCYQAVWASRPLRTSLASVAADAAIVAGSSRGTAARAAIWEPAASIVPNSIRRCSIASAVTSADRPSSWSARSLPTISSVSLARKRRSTSNASLSSTRSGVSRRSASLWSLATSSAARPATAISRRRACSFERAGSEPDASCCSSSLKPACLKPFARDSESPVAKSALLVGLERGHEGRDASPFEHLEELIKVRLAKIGDKLRDDAIDGFRFEVEEITQELVGSGLLRHRQARMLRAGNPGG